ncbi:hypothetical protein NE236_19510 [Actinoallomurus purpureus]|uniref:hypothetical protein n=1 Tax=Actinoallomurus purpureus TaxID=478114 RepID=UPI002092D21E|nr:hypothetical protein [Actinoallomurus purpureus]MCO6007173.1 hypothetical protein [Actinoallomurus purpureus]
MALLRKAIVATAVAGVALAGAAGTASAGIVPPKPKPGHFTAYGPAVKKVHGKVVHLQTVTGTAKVTAWTTVKWNAVNKTYNKKTHKGAITVVFTYVNAAHQAKTKPFTVKATADVTFAIPMRLKQLTVQVFQGKKHGARVAILGGK